MKTKEITLTGDTQQLSAGERIRYVRISNPAGNATITLSGSQSPTGYPIKGDDNQLFPETNLKNIWVTGTVSETINIAYA